MTKGAAARRIVRPSGGALATWFAPIEDAAPGLFSITIDQPARSDSFWPSARATMSDVPPGAKGTMKLIGRAG